LGNSTHRGLVAWVNKVRCASGAVVVVVVVVVVAGGARASQSVSWSVSQELEVLPLKGRNGKQD